jgi:hypothetical protein
LCHDEWPRSRELHIGLALVGQCARPDISNLLTTGPLPRIKPRATLSKDAVSRPRTNERDQQDNESEPINYAHHHFIAIGPVHCRSSMGISGRLAARSRCKWAVLVLRILRWPVIDAKLRPNAAPINTWGFPVAASSRSLLSSSEVHGLLLFFGIARADVRARLSSSTFRRA